MSDENANPEVKPEEATPETAPEVETAPEITSMVSADGCMVTNTSPDGSKVTSYKDCL